MKLKLDDVVYTNYGDGLTKTKVAYLGKETFITDHFNKGYDFGYEFYFKDYNIDWFTSFKKAKETILQNNSNTKLIKKDEDYWEIIDDE